jgi:hypothetical protein
MSKYRELRMNKPQLTIKEEAREVIFTLVSCMCNNVSYVKFYKNDNGDFRIQSTTKNGMGNAFSNYQIKHPKDDIEWEADDNNWDKVITMINSGTSVIESVKSR